MGLLRPRERLRLVVPMLDWILEALKFVLLPVAILSVGYRFLFHVVTISSELNVFAAYGIFAIAICVGYVLLIQTRPAREVLDTVTTSFRRTIVMSCAGVPDRLDRTWAMCRLACREFSQPRLSYPDQQIVVEQLIEILRASSDSRSNFSVVLGESGYGKTTIAFMLANALIRHRKLSALADRIFYYDLGEGERTQTAILQHLGGIRHWNAVVILDNFHHADARILRLATRHVLDGPGSSAERFLLFLAQPPKTWKAAKGGEARLLSEAKSRCRLFKLRGVNRQSIREDDLRRSVRPFMDRIAKLNGERIASIAELQVIQMVETTPADARLAADVISLLEAGLHLPTAERSRVTTAIAIAAALSLQRGSFTFRSFARAAYRVCGGRISALQQTVQLVGVLFRLARLGVMPRTSLPGKLFVFHEALAIAFRRTLVDDPTFEPAFVAAMRWRLAIGPDRQDPTIQWIGACEMLATNEMSTWFEPALLSGGLHIMATHLEPNWQRISGSQAATFQLGLLLDRCGRFADARRYFDALRIKLGAGDLLLDRLTLAEVEASHGSDSKVRLLEVAAHGHPEDVIAAEYWLLHLRAHQGEFAPQALVRLADVLSARFRPEEIAAKYSLTYLGSRILFDACRQAYLADAIPTSVLSQISRSNLAGTLQRSYPQYRAMTLLYMKAHVLGHLVLPICAIQGRSERESVKFLNLDPQKLTPQVVLDLARVAYQEAKDEFSISGDRESLYLDADLLNLDICDPKSNLDDVQAKLHDYESFIRDSGFSDIASYAHVYWFRWHVAKRIRLLERDQPNLEDVDWHDGEARRRIKLAEVCDHASHNNYGQWRCQLFRVLFACLSPGDPDAAVEELHLLRARATKAGYARDAALLGHLLGGDRLSLLRVRQSLLFHPFVHQ